MAIEIRKEDLIYYDDCSIWFLCKDIIRCMEHDKEVFEKIKKDSACTGHAALS